MKRNLLLTAMLAMLCWGASATKFTINVQDFSFSPADGFVQLGDTIVFMHINGTHTTTSISVPAGASTWDSPLDNSQQMFIYVPTVVGFYQYDCTPHATMGMKGQFTVQAPTAIPNVENTALFNFYPNPAGSFTHVKFNSVQNYVSIYVTDISGNVLLSHMYNNLLETDVDIANLPEGRYILYASNGSSIFAQHLVVQ